MKTKSRKLLTALFILTSFTTLNWATGFSYTNDYDAETTINQIASRLARDSNLSLSYRILIQHYPEVNAYSTPEGQIIVTRGLLQSVSTEEELAGVIAHEMGHMISFHQRKQGRSFIGYSADEFSADKRGMQLLEKAGYSPAGLAAMLSLIIERDGRRLPKAQVWEISRRIHVIEKNASRFTNTPASKTAGGI
jgi:predicted Zn-dependent protease